MIKFPRISTFNYSSIGQVNNMIMKETITQFAFNWYEKCLFSNIFNHD